MKWTSTAIRENSDRAVACGYGTFGLGWVALSVRWAVDGLVTGRDAVPARFRASRGAAP